MTGFKDTGIPILFQPAKCSLHNYNLTFREFTNATNIFFHVLNP